MPLFMTNENFLYRGHFQYIYCLAYKITRDKLVVLGIFMITHIVNYNFTIILQHLDPTCYIGKNNYGMIQYYNIFIFQKSHNKNIRMYSNSSSIFF